MKPGNDLITLVDQKLLHNNVAAGSRILVGISGGADSVALLLALHALAISHTYTIQAVHVNHGLRKSAADDQWFVEKLCAKLNIPIFVCNVNGGRKPGGTSPEQHWKQLRYAEFERVMQETQSEFLALGHNADDLVETFLYHLTRGTGLNGLTFRFINKVKGLHIIRPLWQTPRSQIESSLIATGHEWITDPTNNDTRYNRNLIRHKVVPVLRQINPAATDAILRVSQDISGLLNLHETESDLLDNDKTVSLALQKIKILQDAQAVRTFVQYAAGEILDRRQTAQAMHMIQSSGTGTVSLPGRKTMVITQDRAWIYPGAEPTDKDIATLHAKVFGGTFAEITSGSLAGVPGQPVEVTGLDGNQWQITNNATVPVHFRNRLPGDRAGSKTVSKLMIEHRVPWYLRDYVIWAIDPSETIVGIVGFDELQHWFNRRNGQIYNFSYTKSPSSA